MLSLLLMGAAAVMQTDDRASPSNSAVYLTLRIFALQANETNQRLIDVANDANEMLKQKQGLQSLYDDLVREQDRLVGENLAESRRRPWRNAAITRDQRAWAMTLSRLCPPGSNRHDCLAKAMVDRLGVLKARPTP